MTPSLGSYIGGCLAVVGILAAVGLGGYWLRRWIVPEFSGALARLADATIATALLIVALELLGSLSILTLGWTVLVCIGVGLLAAWIGWHMADGSREVKAPQVQTIALLLAIGVASFAVAEWTFPSQLSLDQGMYGGDTTWYHMPFSGRFAQEGSIVHLHFTDPLRLAAWFYPQSSELVHAGGIVIFKSDWLSPLLNLIWLSIALLAAWCVGRPYRVGPATLVAGAIVLDAGVMIETQPGEGRNDIMGLAFLLAFAAFLINGHQRRAPAGGAAVRDAPDEDAPLLDKGPLVVAGIAAGLAASVKLTFLIPVVAIGLGVVAFSGRGRRLTTAWVLGLSAFVAGGYWYVRAAIKTGGNPIPQIGFGPLHLPRPDQMPLDPRPRFAVADYLAEPTIYRKWFFPRLDDAFGPLWPLILIVAGAAAIYLVVRSRSRIVQVLAGAALLTAAVYVVTPLTAAGQEGSPTGFFTNTRYLVPGLVLALTMLPIARPLRAPNARAWQTLLFLVAVYAITVLMTPRWYPGFIVGTVFLTLCLVWAPAGLGMLRAERRISRGQVAAALGAVLLLAVVLGRAQEVQYFKHHYTNVDHFLQDGGPKHAYSFARNQHDKRIGIAGAGTIFFGQYGYYGENLDNHVQYIGMGGPNGTYRLPTSCRGFRHQINEGDYDYLILSQYTMDTTGPYQQPVYAWIKRDPAVTLLVSEPHIEPQPDYVFRVDGKLDPDGCKPE